MNVAHTGAWKQTFWNNLLPQGQLAQGLTQLPAWVHTCKTQLLIYLHVKLTTPYMCMCHTQKHQPMGTHMLTCMYTQSPALSHSRFHVVPLTHTFLPQQPG